MGIRLSERSEVLCVPYGAPNDEGTPDATFVDLKAHPERIPVLAACLGWPETRRLLEAINASDSGLMSLAADQAFTSVEDVARPSVLTSFVTLCFADLKANAKGALQQLGESLAGRLDEGLQHASNAGQRALHIEALFEVQPTVFRLAGDARDRPALRISGGSLSGWSLTIALAAQGRDVDDARQLWGIAITALVEALHPT